MVVPLLWIMVYELSYFLLLIIGSQIWTKIRLLRFGSWLVSLLPHTASVEPVSSKFVIYIGSDGSGSITVGQIHPLLNSQSWVSVFLCTQVFIPSFQNMFSMCSMYDYNCYHIISTRLPFILPILSHRANAVLQLGVTYFCSRLYVDYV